jgi:C4-dicarboxylate-specific signal transduction histidine kinase
MLNNALFRSVWLPTVITTLLLLISLSLLVIMSWHKFERLKPIEQRVTHLIQLQETGLELQEMLLNRINTDQPVDKEKAQKLRNDINGLMSLRSHLLPETPGRLNTVYAALGDLPNQPKEALTATLSKIRETLFTEARVHETTLRELNHDILLELQISMITLFTLPLILATTLFSLRKKILTPINNVTELFTLLASNNYSQVSLNNADGLLVPVFVRYNQLVKRLQELELEHQSREQSLENQVRNTTHTLLQQQKNLADAERLSTVGEIAAGLAHEIRNPLAGAHLALSNLKQELNVKEHQERIDLILNELRRLSELLNILLSQSQHTPEKFCSVHFAAMVNELINLARYQLPAAIKVNTDIPENLVCHLPEHRTRQAILNLVLNAGEALKTQPGNIEISVQSSDKNILIQIKDNGPGFSNKLLKEGIRPFASGRTQGTGLGLTLVRRFVRDLDGSIEISNLSPYGACVRLHIPCVYHYE